MPVNGIDSITYGVTDLTATRKFFIDWGLTLAHETADALDFSTLNGCMVHVRRADDASLPPAMESGSTLREVVWGVESEADLAQLKQSIGNGSLTMRDPMGLTSRFQVTRKKAIDVKGSPSNAWGHTARVDRPSPVYERATPIEVGHVVFLTDKLAETEAFYRERAGFVLSDRYPGRGVFLRVSPRGEHHNLFLLSPPGAKNGLNHVAFAVRDIHEVFGGGLHISRCGWETQIGPGRHPISSAYFW
ncbi:MAG: VOC family protein, partial [Burkholderiales bacterium]